LSTDISHKWNVRLTQSEVNVNISPNRGIDKQSIARRFAVGLAVTVLAVSTIAVGAMYRVVSQAAAREVEQRADEVLAYLVGTLETPLWAVDYGVVRAVGAAVSNDASIAQLIVRNESGTVIYSKEKNWEGGTTDRFAKIVYKQDSSENLVGNVSVSLANKAYQAGNQQLMLSSAVIIIFILGAVVVVAMMSIRPPLERLLKSFNQIADRFAAGSYDIPDYALPYIEFQPFGRALVQVAKTIEEQIDAIRVAEGKYRRIFENALEGVFQSSLDGHFLSANPALAKILGYVTPDELLARAGDSTDGLYVDQAQHGRLLELLQEQGAVADYEVQLLRKDGQVIWVSISARMVRNANSQPLLTEGFLADITERKRAENALRLSSERLQLATRVANIGIWDWNIVKNELVWDDSMYQLYGIRREDFGGAYDSWIRTIHPEDKAHTDGEIQAALRGEHEYAPEYRIIRTDGSIRYIKANSQTTKDREGKPLRMIGTNIDITELKQAETSIRTLNQELEQRVAERTGQLEIAIYDLENINYSASHDLRIPLRAVDGFSKILLNKYSGQLDAEGCRLLNVVRANTKKMAQYIDDMLIFSGIGRVAIKPAQVDMNQLVRELAAELRSNTKGGELKIEIGKLPPAFADHAMIRMVMHNLLSNAIKFGSTRAVSLVEVGALTDDKEAVYFVRDNGVGFDMQYADKLFGVFQRLHGVEEFEGVGIGLAIVKRIVNRHGGRVWAEGKVDGGATFYFSLPRAGPVK